MEHESDTDSKLARLVAGELRVLPMRRAPDSLQSRVFAELARRQSLPWWQQSFRAWPLAAQVAFAVIALAVTQALFWVLAGPGVSGVVQAVQSAGQEFAHGAQVVGSWFGALHWLTRDMVAAVPSRWMTALLLSMLGSLGVLFGSGTFVYRSLQSRS
jgi:hypothetical protein